MNDSPYERFATGQLILRDELAVDRTLLANERTLLAYLRSAVALVIAGVSIMHFSTAGWFWWIGIACVPFGIIAGAVGIVRYRKVDRSISRLRDLPAETSDTAKTTEIPGTSDSRCEAFTLRRDSPSR